MIPDFALTIRRVKQRGNRSGERCGMVGGAEFPGVGEKDGDDFSEADAGSDQAAGDALDDLSVFGVSQTATAGGIHQCGFRWITAARLKHEIVEEYIVGIGVEMCAQHAGGDFTG